MDFLGRHRSHQSRGGVRFRRRGARRGLHPTGRIHGLGPLPGGVDRRARAHVRARGDRPGVVEPPDRRRLRRAPHARPHGQPRDDLLSPGPRRGRLAAGPRRRHLRPGRRHPVPLGGHVPRADADRRGAAHGLRRTPHGHLRQIIADAPLQGRPRSRRRLPVGNLGPCVAHRSGKRRAVLRQLGKGAENGLLPRPARKPPAGQTLRQGPHRAQHLLLHGRVLGLRPLGRRRGSLLGGLFRARRGAGHGEHAAQLRRQCGPLGGSRRRGGLPEGHRRQIRPDHPRPAGLRQAPQGAGQRHAGLQAAQRPGLVADPSRRHPLHVLLLAGRHERAVPHDGLFRRRHRGPQGAHPAPADPARRPPDQHLPSRRRIPQGTVPANKPGENC